MSPLAADDPISSAQDDLLGRAPFAAAVATTVRRAPRGSGFVIAITGPWGDGKTSVINMVVESLEADEVAVVVRFNPWLFSGTQELLTRFFAEVAAQLPSDSDRSDAVSAGLRRYAGAVGPFQTLPAIGGVLQTTSEVAQGAADLIAPLPESAYEIAADLRSTLAGLDRPIAVIVDDIDRLHPNEIGDVMRLVRLVGDFPNLVYLLAFDRARVEEALGGGPDRRVTGAEYLEKIVQANFEVPAIRPEDRDKVLRQALSDALGDLTGLIVDGDALTNVFVKGLRPLIRSLRDVRRFANALPAAIQVLGDEVEVADMLGLEALRLFEPASFELILREPDAFTATGRAFDSQGADDARRQAVEMTIAAATNTNAVEALVGELFPAARRYLDRMNYGPDWEGRWRRARRVAARDVLEVFLTRRRSAGAVANSLVRAVLASADDRAALDDLLVPLSSEELEALLDRLSDHSEDLRDRQPEHLIGALLDCADALRVGRTHLEDAGADIALGRVLYRTLNDRDPVDVARAVRAVRTTSLWGRYELVLVVGHVEGVGHRLVAEDVAADLERELVNDVLAAPAAELADARELTPLLGMAQRVDPDGLAGRWDTWLADDAFVLSLLTSAVLESVGQTLGRAGVKRTLLIRWTPLADMVGQDRLATAVRRGAAMPDSSTLSERDRTVLDQAVRYAADPAAARRALERWGRSFDDDDDPAS